MSAKHLHATMAALLPLSAPMITNPTAQPAPATITPAPAMFAGVAFAPIRLFLRSMAFAAAPIIPATRVL